MSKPTPNTETSEIVEACAEAIFLANGRYYGGFDIAWKDVGPYRRQAYREMAQAALDAAEQRASSERNKALEAAAAIASEQEEDGSYVWADGFEIADAIRALQNGGGDA